MLNIFTKNKIAKAHKIGSWYNANPQELNKELDQYLANANITSDKKPRMIITPHPGLVFGGPTAGFSYGAVAKFEYQNIYLIAVSHLSSFNQIILGDFTGYETPFGVIQANQDIVDFFQYKSKNCVIENTLIENEHALEMQYPFIKKLWSNAKLIPIVISDINVTTELADLIYQAITPEDLVIISTDLSHYPAYNIANEIDLETLKLITTNNTEGLLNRIQDNKRSLGTDTYACGAIGVIAGLKLMQGMNLKQSELLHYENSGDNFYGDKNAVVGYGAVAFLTDNNEKFFETINLDIEEKNILLSIARNTIKDSLARKKYFPEFNISEDSLLNQLYGVFVTLTINGNLRGCMGNFDPSEPLFKVVESVAKMSAFDDPRFPQVQPNELEKIKITISVLSPRKRINNYHEIVPGKHGVYIQKGFRGGTYLPQVAPEQGWDRTAMMNSLCESKSGLPRNCWQDGTADMFTYTALVFGEPGAEH